MKNITKITITERKEEFTKYIQDHVKTSSDRYIRDLEKGFSMAPVLGYTSLYEITDPEILEDKIKTKALRECAVFTRASVGGTAGLAGLNWYIRFLKDSRDSYYDFMNHFGIKPKELFEWGMQAIIFPPDDKVETEWKNLKDRINNNSEVYIRGYGRDAHGTQLYLDFYKYLFKNSNVRKDPTNNNKPTSNLKKMTGLGRNKEIYNYQVSHIWGKTKNVFLFEAPWNICYTPKIIDPFTGHETKGDLPEEFKQYFFEYSQKKYRKYILDYNHIISSLEINKNLEEFCKKIEGDNSRFKNDALNELSQIPML